MSENKMIDILKAFDVKTHRINGRVMAEMWYTQNGVIGSELVEVDAKKHTVDGCPIYLWLGYDNLLQMMRDYNRTKNNH